MPSVFISQPALSRRLEKLESSLQTRLLDRTTRRVSLTEAGRHFLTHAKAAIEELEVAVLGMTERSLRRKELVTLACVPSVANHLLPLVLQTFVKTHPSVRIKVIDESAKAVLDSVVSGAADFGMNFIGTQEADIEFKAIHTENYVLVVRNDHPLASMKTISWGALANEKLVSVSQSSGNRMLIDNALSRVANRPSIQFETNHVAGALALVTAGLGVSVLPALALELSHPTLLSIPLTDPVVTRTLGLITRKGSKLHPTALALYSLLENVASAR